MYCNNHCSKTNSLFGHLSNQLTLVFNFPNQLDKNKNKMKSCIESGVVQEGAFEILTPSMTKFISLRFQSLRLEAEKGINHAFQSISIVGEDLSLCH